MSIFQQKFLTGEVVKAADVTNNALQTWAHRGYIVAQRAGPGDDPSGPGSRRQFSFFNVMEIAIAKALVDAGITVEQAFKAAGFFAHSSDQSRTGGGIRLPSLPFPHEVQTLIAVAGDRSVTAEWSVRYDPYPALRADLGQPVSMTVLAVNPIFDKVCAALGYGAANVLTEAYNG